MYRVLILNKNDLSILASSKISTINFKEDLIVSQTTSITLLNDIKYEPNNDFVFITGNDFSYLGIVDSLNEITPMKLTISPILNLFNINIYESTYNGEIGALIKGLIDDYLITNEDELVNLKNVEIINSINIEDSFTFDETNIYSLKEVLQELILAYDLVIETRVEFNLGKPSKIVLEIKTINNKIVLKEAFSFIQDVVIEDNSSININKITYIPSTDNETYTTTRFTYCLLNDGSITTDINDSKRIVPVIYNLEFYSDTDYDNLEELATAALQLNTYEHYISFTLYKNDLVNYEAIVLGNQITFMTNKGKTYHSVISQIERTNFNGNIKVLLGVKRITLTDKLKQGGLQLWR